MMINLNFHLLDKPLVIENMTVLVMEDHHAFATLVEKLYQYEEDGDIRLYYDDMSEVKVSELQLITDILAYDLNSNALHKRVVSDLLDQLNQAYERKTKIEKLLFDLYDLLCEELVDHELNLSLDEFQLDKYLSSLKIRCESQADSIFEKILSIVQVSNYLGKQKLLILVNVLSYLNESEIIKLEEYVSLSGIDILCLETHKVEGVDQLCMDADYYFYEIKPDICEY